MSAQDRAVHRDVADTIRAASPAQIAAALRCRAVNRAGARCRLDAPHLGQRHEPESAAAAVAADLDDDSDEELARQERSDEEAREP